MKNALSTLEPVSIAVVGHANTGKTSLIRTLLRDGGFGDVADYAGTTRHVEAVAIKVDGKERVSLFDTPGLEDSSGLMEVWEDLNSQKNNENKNKLVKFKTFIDQLASDKSFEQELKVLKQAMTSDCLLYVIDARLPVLGKFKDELLLLKQLGKPLIPVLNFIDGNDENVALWRQGLKEEHLHAIVEYDTVAFTFEAERRLYEKMQSLVENRYDDFNAVLQQSERRYEARIQAGVSVIADMMIDVGAYRRTVSELTEDQIREDMQDTVREREQRCVEQLLKAFDFDNDDVVAEFLPIKNGRWERDVFDPRVLKEFGVNTSTDAAKGAVVGGGIDLMVGGLSMGAGAAIGAVAGALFGAANRYGKAIWETVSGTHHLCVDDATVQLLYIRQMYLCRSLMQRGHAAQTPLSVTKSLNKTGVDEFTSLLAEMRRHPSWSSLNKKNPLFDIEDRAEEQFKEKFLKLLIKQI